jgi:hypothetical protein
MDLQRKEAIVKALKEKKVSLPCSRCDSLNFQIIGQTILSMNENPRIVSLGGSNSSRCDCLCSMRIYHTSCLGFSGTYAWRSRRYMTNLNPNEINFSINDKVNNLTIEQKK